MRKTEKLLWAGESGHTYLLVDVVFEWSRGERTGSNWQVPEAEETTWAKSQSAGMRAKSDDWDKNVPDHSPLA